MDVVGSIKSWWETTDSEGRFIIVHFCFVLQRCISASVACVAQPGRGGGVACVACVDCVACVAQPGRGGGVACVA